MLPVPVFRSVLACLFVVCLATYVGADASEGERFISEQAQTSLRSNVTVTAWMAGDIASVDVVEGEQVDEQEPLVLFDSELATLELHAAKEAYQALQLRADNDANIQHAQLAFDLSLKEQQQHAAANQAYRGTVSATELERLQLIVDQSRLAIEQAKFERQITLAHAGEKQAAMAVAQAKLRKHTIVSPRAGTVAEVFVQPGQRVEVGDPLVRIIDLRELRIECLVDAQRATRCAPNDVIMFRTADDQEHAGVIDFVSPEVEPVSGKVRLVATVYNEKGELRPGLRGKMFAVR